MDFDSSHNADQMKSRTETLSRIYFLCIIILAIAFFGYTGLVSLVSDRLFVHLIQLMIIFYLPLISLSIPICVLAMFTRVKDSEVVSPWIVFPSLLLVATIVFLFPGQGMFFADTYLIFAAIATVLTIATFRFLSITRPFVGSQWGLRVLLFCTVILLPLGLYGIYDLNLLDRGVPNQEFNLVLSPNETYVSNQLSNWGTEIPTVISFTTNSSLALYIVDNSRPDIVYSSTNSSVLLTVDGTDPHHRYYAALPYRLSLLFIVADWRVAFHNPSQNGTVSARVIIGDSTDFIIDPPPEFFAYQRALFRTFLPIIILGSMWFSIRLSISYDRLYTAITERPV